MRLWQFYLTVFLILFMVKRCEGSCKHRNDNLQVLKEAVQSINKKIPKPTNSKVYFTPKG